jgi:hypothetical protein
LLARRAVHYPGRCLFPGPGEPAGPAEPGSAPAIRGRGGRVDRPMTLEEKILQLLAYQPNGVPRLGIPDLETCELLHGVLSDGATCFPQAIAMGAMWDPDLMEQIGAVGAREARALGIGQAFTPMLGLARDPRWGRVEESYGEDPYHVSRERRGLHQRHAGHGNEPLRPGQDHRHGQAFRGRWRTVCRPERRGLRDLRARAARDLFPAVRGRRQGGALRRSDARASRHQRRAVPREHVAAGRGVAEGMGL